jgi:predicted nucleic acid-binding protein
MTAALPKWRNPNWANWLKWLTDVSVLGEAAPLRRTVKRDPKDDPVLAAALGDRAAYLVSYDRDLLDLEKPFGIQCVHPRAFLIVLVSTVA